MAATRKIESRNKSKGRSWRSAEVSFLKLPKQSMSGRVENFSPGWLPQGYEVCIYIYILNSSVL